MDTKTGKTTDATAKKPAATKGTKTTELIIGKAANLLTTAVKNLQTAVLEGSKLEEIMGDQALTIQSYEERINSLVTEFEQKKSEQEFNLQLEFKTNQKRFSEIYLSENNLISVLREDWIKTNQDLENLKRDFDSKLSSEVGKTKGILEAQAKSEKLLLESEFKAKEAGNAAEITNLKTQLQFMKEQAESWRNALDHEREAGVKRAQASAIGSVNVGAPGGR